MDCFVITGCEVTFPCVCMSLSADMIIIINLNNIIQHYRLALNISEHFRIFFIILIKLDEINMIKFIKKTIGNLTRD